MTRTNGESQTYQQMLTEVEQILKDVSSQDLDLDKMVERIEHGYGLIKTMRERLDATKTKVDKLREQFAQGGEASDKN